MDMVQLIELANAHANCDYSSRRAVRMANQAADKFRLIVTNASEHELEPVFDLIDHPIAGGWFAFSVLDVAHPSQEQRLRCIRFLQTLANGDSPEAFGARVWLKEHLPNA
jgi:hypothetical protein